MSRRSLRQDLRRLSEGLNRAGRHEVADLMRMGYFSIARPVNLMLLPAWGELRLQIIERTDPDTGAYLRVEAGRSKPRPRRPF